MSWANYCACSGLHGGGPGSLFSWYTSLYSSHISPEEVLYPMSWMAGTSALASSPGLLAGSLGKLLAPFLSIPTLHHVGTFFGG